MIAQAPWTWQSAGNSALITDAYIAAANQKHGPEYTFWARMDSDGRVEVAQVLEIVAVMADPYRQVRLADIRQHDETAKLGQYIVNIIDPVVPDDAGNLPIIRNLRISAG